LREALFLSIVCFSFVTGCASSKFARENLRREVGVKSPRYEEKDIEAVFQKQVNLPKPFRMAVYFKATNPRRDRNWRWTLEEKDKFVKNLRENISGEYVSQVFLMDESLADAEDLMNIRLSAAKFGADAVMVVDGGGDVDRTINKWTATYALVLPMLFVNGTTADSYFAVNATLWDVRNEMLYASLSGEGEMKKNYPIAWQDPDSVFYAETKSRAMASLEKAVKDFHEFQK